MAKHRATLSILKRMVKTLERESVLVSKNQVHYTHVKACFIEAIVHLRLIIHDLEQE